MPKGYVVTRWDDDEGLIITANYPKSLIIDYDDLMRIFYTHITGKGEAGNVLVRLESTKTYVYSYFTGMKVKTPSIISLFLDIGEDQEVFGDTLIAELNDGVIKHINNLSTNYTKNIAVVKKLEDYLAKAINLLERLKNLTREQTLAQIFNSEKGRAALEFLQEGPKTRKNLQLLIEDKLDKTVSNLEVILDLLTKTNLIEQDWIEGYTDIFLFLIEDFQILRKPPLKLIEAAKKNKPNSNLAKKYLEKVYEFYSEYTPNDIVDTFLVSSNMINPDKYDLIALFRERPYPLEKLPASPNESIMGIKDTVRTMEKDHIVAIIKDIDDVEWVFLLSDTVIVDFFPEYLVEKIREDHGNGFIKKDIALKHLKFLEKNYVEVKEE